MPRDNERPRTCEPVARKALPILIEDVLVPDVDARNPVVSVARHEQEAVALLGIRLLHQPFHDIIDGLLAERRRPPSDIEALLVVANEVLQWARAARHRAPNVPPQDSPTGVDESTVFRVNPSVRHIGVGLSDDSFPVGCRGRAFPFGWILGLGTHLGGWRLGTHLGTHLGRHGSDNNWRWCSCFWRRPSCFWERPSYGGKPHPEVKRFDGGNAGHS